MQNYIQKSNYTLKATSNVNIQVLYENCTPTAQNYSLSDVFA